MRSARRCRLPLLGILLLLAPALAERDPCAVALSADGATLCVAEATGRRVTLLATADGQPSGAVPLPAEPTGLAVAGAQVVVTCGVPQGQVLVIDPATRRVVRSFAAGYGACAPVLSADGRTLFVAERYEHRVAAFELATGRLRWRVAASREPVAMALSPAGRLFVANLLPAMAATEPVVAAAVTVIDAGRGQLLAQALLPDGSSSVRGVAVSPDGASVYVTHILGRYHQPTTQLDRGWMNTNALSVLDGATGRWRTTVLLDEVDRGAANPWAVACDAERVVVTHAGTHELSVIDAAALQARLAKAVAEDVPEDLAFLLDLRRRVPVPGQSPRALALAGGQAWVACTYSDSVATVDLARGSARACPLGPAEPMSEVRRGQLLFGDASLCFQNWQSCVSCHPDARADGLNWDLLNDGIGNPKNTRSLLLAHRTPPAMSLGVRATAEEAVRAGIRHIQFMVRPEADAAAIDAYLKALAPLPGPRRVNGLTAAAKRGQKLFESPAVGCASCHPAPLYCDGKQHDLGMGQGLDAGKAFSTPTLVELWRTAPYLHDGRSATLREMLTRDNPGDRHGRTSRLKPGELADLVEYLETL